MRTSIKLFVINYYLIICNIDLLSTGQCIDIADLCDGLPNCADQSDELVKYCAAIDCQRFAFRCGNGACINTKLKCDGQINCIDGKQTIFDLNVSFN